MREKLPWILLIVILVGGLSFLFFGNRGSRERLGELQARLSDAVQTQSRITDQLGLAREAQYEAQLRVGELTKQLRDVYTEIENLTGDLERSRGIVDSLSSELGGVRDIERGLGTVIGNIGDFIDRVEDYNAEG